MKTVIPIILFLLKQSWNGDAGLTLSASKVDKYGIVGGKTIDISEAPYQVTITYKGFPICNGALIAEDVVVTTAICILTGRHPASAFFKVRVGSSKINEDGEYITVRKFKIHPDYSQHNWRRFYDYNIGLLWLSKPVTLSNKVRLINMTEPGEEIKDDQTLLVSGWGMTSDRKIADQLQLVEVQAMNIAKCQSMFKPFIDLTKQMMCAGVYEGGYGLCHGDEAAPLVYEKKLAGLGSFNIDSCGDPILPAQAYTKISALRNWVEESIKNETNHKNY